MLFVRRRGSRHRLTSLAALALGCGPAAPVVVTPAHVAVGAAAPERASEPIFPEQVGAEQQGSTPETYEVALT